MSQFLKIIELTFVILAYLQFCTLVPLESNDQGRKVNHWIEVQKMLKEKVVKLDLKNQKDLYQINFEIPQDQYRKNSEICE